MACSSCCRFPRLTSSDSGLTPFYLLAAETLAYLVGGYIVYRLRAYTNKRLYAICFAIVVVCCALLYVTELPAGAIVALQVVVYMALALLNLCWGRVLRLVQAICFDGARHRVLYHLERVLAPLLVHHR